MLARSSFLVLAIPLGFMWTRVNPAFRQRMLTIGSMIVIQGSIGWWMVKSGLEDSAESIKTNEFNKDNENKYK